jgi:hypothetical protein
MAKGSKINQSSPRPDGDADPEGEGRGASRPRPRGLKGRWRALKAWWREARRWGYPAAVAGTLLLFIFGVAAVWFPSAFGPDVRGAFEAMGAFTGYFFLVGLLLFAPSAYLATLYLLKAREFARLVETPSKGDFIKTQDRIERLAFELGRREQDQVAARKKEFRIRH